MESLIQLGKIAGIAGISLGIIFLLLKQLIAKNIFPNLTRQQSYNIIRLIVILLFVIGIVGMILWTYGPSKNNSDYGILHDQKDGPPPIPAKDSSIEKKKKPLIHLVDTRTRGYFVGVVKKILNNDSTYILQDLVLNEDEISPEIPDIVIIHLHAFINDIEGKNSLLAKRMGMYYRRNKNTQFIVYSRSFDKDNGSGWLHDSPTDISALNKNISPIYLPNADKLTPGIAQSLVDSVHRKIQLVNQ